MIGTHNLYIENCTFDNIYNQGVDCDDSTDRRSLLHDKQYSIFELTEQPAWNGGQAEFYELYAIKCLYICRNAGLLLLAFPGKR